MSNKFYIIKYYLEYLEHTFYGIEDSDVEDLRINTIIYNINNIDMCYIEDQEEEDMINKIKKYIRLYESECE